MVLSLFTSCVRRGYIASTREWPQKGGGGQETLPVFFLFYSYLVASGRNRLFLPCPQYGLTRDSSTPNAGGPCRARAIWSSCVWIIVVSVLYRRGWAAIHLDALRRDVWAVANKSRNAHCLSSNDRIGTLAGRGICLGIWMKPGSLAGSSYHLKKL